jgi:hypothetical protein
VDVDDVTKVYELDSQPENNYKMDSEPANMGKGDSAPSNVVADDGRTSVGAFFSGSALGQAARRLSLSLPGRVPEGKERRDSRAVHRKRLNSIESCLSEDGGGESVSGGKHDKQGGFW